MSTPDDRPGFAGALTDGMDEYAEKAGGGAESGLRPGDVVRYEPDPSRHDPRWCREGMAIADGRGVLFDTYWGSGSDNHRLNDAEIASAEPLFNLADYDELDRYDRSAKGIWETYHPDDRRFVSSQHRLQFRRFIRKDATPDVATMIANAEERVREAEAEVASAQRRADWTRADLAALLTRPTPPAEHPTAGDA